MSMNDNEDVTWLPRGEAETEVLRILLDDDESPWILHAILEERFPGLDILNLLKILQDMESAGLIEKWLPEAISSDEVEYEREALDAYRRSITEQQDRKDSFQEYGPWFTLTAMGRTRWRHRTKD
jgi:hypothetical protein